MSFGGVIQCLLFRKHVQYFGGFHPAHKVVRWLWDTVANDFNSKEKALFLKVQYQK